MSRRSKYRTAARPRQVRIIGGRWRGRRLKVGEARGLRPTPDRVRETLFNWLQPHLQGARCLDLFAGSGALGFEAASRGADSVVLIENNPTLVDLLRQGADELGADTARIVQADGLAWLREQSQAFDIVFLDPPYADSPLQQACALLLQRRLLADGALVYVESGMQMPVEVEGLEKFKQGRAGQVQYGLLKFTRNPDNDEDGNLSRHL